MKSAAVAEIAEGVCSTVEIEISQTATLTQSAFEATLKVNNETDQALEALAVDIDIRNALNEPANDLFAGVDMPELSNISAIDGSQPLPAGASATAQWTLVPSDFAAPDGVTPYTVGGSFSYFYNGEFTEVPLFPVPIYVYPNPSLNLDYFLEEVVYADDPFTPEIEPSVPFSLGLLVDNAGNGIAKDLTITSSQPKIVDNENGLVIDFDIIGTQLGLDAISPALSISFGNIEGGDSAVARWLMVSSLQGEFISFDASYEHVSGLDTPEFSLIDSVEIRGLTHMVLDDESEAKDLKPDFLVDDFPDPDDLADTVFLSNATTEDVTTITSAEVSTDEENLTATVTASIPDGWFYLRLDDPFDGAYPLSSVQRADGKEIAFDYNAWQTSRIIRPLGEPAYAERLVHVFDRNGLGTYTFTFDPDGTPPKTVNWQAVASHGDDLDEVPLSLTKSPTLSDPRAGGITQLLVTFDGPIDPETFTDASVFVEGLGLGNAPIEVPPHTVDLRTGDLVGVIDFAEPLPDIARYCVQLNGVMDLAGNLLSGDDANFRVAALAGDATGDLRVNNTDVGGVLSLVGTDPIDTANPLHVRSDVNQDGKVDMDDVTLVLDLRGTDLGGISNPCIVISPEAVPLDGSEAVSLDDGQASTPAPVGDEPAFELGGNANAPSPAEPPSESNQASANDALAGDGSPADADSGVQYLPEPGQYLVDPTRIAVRPFDPTANADSRATAVATLTDFGFAATGVQDGPSANWTIGELPQSYRSPDARETLSTMLASQGLWMSPVLIDSTGRALTIEPELEVTFRDGVPEDWALAVLQLELGPEVTIASGTPGATPLTITLTEAQNGDEVLTTALQLAIRRDVDSAEPKLIGKAPSADLNADGLVDTTDLTILLNAYATPDTQSDLNQDGTVDQNDLQVMLEAVGAM